MLTNLRYELLCNYDIAHKIIVNVYIFDFHKAEEKKIELSFDN